MCLFSTDSYWLADRKVCNKKKVKYIGPWACLCSTNPSSSSWWCFFSQRRTQIQPTGIQRCHVLDEHRSPWQQPVGVTAGVSAWPGPLSQPVVPWSQDGESRWRNYIIQTLSKTKPQTLCTLMFTGHNYQNLVTYRCSHICVMVFIRLIRKQTFKYRDKLLFRVTYYCI